MANTYFTAGLAGLQDGTINLSSDTIHVVLIDDNYTFSASHATMENANIPTADRVGDSTVMGSKTVYFAYFDAADTTIENVASSETVNGAIIYKYNTGTSSSDIPILWLDTGTGFDLTTDGNNVLLEWNENGIITAS